MFYSKVNLLILNNMLKKTRSDLMKKIKDVKKMLEEVNEWEEQIKSTGSEKEKKDLEIITKKRHLHLLIKIFLGFLIGLIVLIIQNYITGYNKYNQEIFSWSAIIIAFLTISLTYYGFTDTEIIENELNEFKDDRLKKQLKYIKLFNLNLEQDKIYYNNISKEITSNNDYNFNKRNN